MTLRRVLLVFHLWAALPASVFLSLLGATGSVLVYEGEVDHALSRRLVAVRPAPPALPWPNYLRVLRPLIPDIESAELNFQIF